MLRSRLGAPEDLLNSNTPGIRSVREHGLMTVSCHTGLFVCVLHP